MEILSVRAIHGPNLFHRKPIVLMEVQLGIWADTASDEKKGFSETLTGILPGLYEHTCSKGYRGGFCERLTTGTYPAHIIEHVALELATLAGIEVSFGKTRYAGAYGKYEIATRFQNEEGMKQALRSAFDIVKQLLEGATSYNIDVEVEKIRDLVLDSKLGPSGQCILDAAIARGIPWKRMGSDSLIQLGYGRHRRFVQAAVTDRTSLIATETAQDKNLTKAILRRNGLPVPSGAVVRTFEGLEDARRDIDGPCVIKPLDGNHGNGVSLNVKTEDEARLAFGIAKEISSRIIVEEMCEGHDYRILVIDGKVVAAAERHPPTVVGDGEQTIQQLIEAMNLDPRRSDGHAGVLTKIVVEDLLIESLAKQGCVLSTVPEKGRVVTLRENANLSSGGTAVDVTDRMHPEVRSICERAARLIGLDICGLDLIHRDIAMPPGRVMKIIEVNAGPGLRMHLAPSAGTPRDVGGAILQMLYPAQAQSRIPVLSVTGTNGKTTVTRLLGKIMGAGGARVGMTTSDGIWIAGEQVMKGDTTGPVSSDIVLSDPSVDVAVLEVARGGMLRAGLAYDQSDVSVVTNIQPDHLGQNGIENIEDLCRVKALVAEHVKPNGTLVLNADDANSVGLRNRASVQKTPKNYFLYSVTGRSPEFLEHLQSGGDAAWIEDGEFWFRKNGETARVCAVRDLSMTMQGAAVFQVSNALAAIAAAASGGCSVAQIRAGLAAFDEGSENIGRMNIYRVRDGYLVVDYAHNPKAIESVANLMRQLSRFSHTAVFGLPGDRNDDLLSEAASKLAGTFERIFVKEDLDLRGRQPGEVASLIQATLQEKAPTASVRVIHDECEALRAALSDIRRNEIVTLFYDHLERSLPVIRDFDPIPVKTIEWIKDPSPTRITRPKIPATKQEVRPHAHSS